MDEEIVLEAKSISKFFGTITALNDVNLKITKGEVLGVVGDNGAGTYRKQNAKFCCKR